MALKDTNREVKAPEFTAKDWNEIYYALEDGSELEAKLGHEGRGKSPESLTEIEWIEIRLALERKLGSPVTQGRDSESREWRRHLRSILDAIKPITREFMG